jgi:hypothetical protein
VLPSVVFRRAKIFLFFFQISGSVGVFHTQRAHKVIVRIKVIFNDNFEILRGLTFWAAISFYHHLPTFSIASCTSTRRDPC